MDEIERCRIEQRRCAEWLLAHPDVSEWEKRGAKQGLDDWTMEEVILTEQEARAKAVYEAFMDIMDASGGYPITRQEIIEECGKAFERFLENHLVMPEEDGMVIVEDKPA